MPLGSKINSCWENDLVLVGREALSLEGGFAPETGIQSSKPGKRESLLQWEKDLLSWSTLLLSGKLGKCTQEEK